MPDFTSAQEYILLGCAICGGTVDDVVLFLTTNAGLVGLTIGAEAMLSRMKFLFKGTTPSSEEEPTSATGAPVASTSAPRDSSSAF